MKLWLIAASFFLFGCASTPSSGPDSAEGVGTRPSVHFDSVAVAFDYHIVDKLPRLTKNARLLFSRKATSGEGGLAMNWLCSVPVKVEVIGSEIRLAQEISAKLKISKAEGGLSKVKRTTQSVTSTFVSLENNTPGPLKRAVLDDFFVSYDRTADFPEINNALFLSSKLGFALGDERSREKVLLSFTKDQARWPSEVGANVACKNIETHEIRF